jgi:hypothetical protein
MSPALILLSVVFIQASDDRFQDATLATLPAAAKLEPIPSATAEVVIGGPPVPERRILFSSDLRRCAFVVSKEGKQFAVVGGQAGEPFDEIRFLQVGMDGKSFGYVGILGEKSFVVVDGKRLGPFATTPDLDLGSGGRFIVTEMSPGKTKIIVDGKPALDGDFAIIAKWSPDGSRYACFTENRDQTEGFVFTEGLRSPHYRRIEWLTFSKQGRRLAYIGRGLEGDTVVVDETRRKVSGGAGQVEFSPDGKRVAYAVHREGWRVCVDGLEGPPFEQVWDLTFSGDSRRFAYAARQEDRWCIVVDGRKGEFYDKADYPVLSPDGKRHWFRAVSEKRKLGILVEPGKPSIVTTSSPPQFSPDGARCLYSIREGEKTVLKLDGEDPGLRGAVQMFVPKSNQLVEVLTSDDGAKIRVGTREGEPVRELGPILIDPEGRLLAYAGLKGDKVVRRVLKLD